MFATEAWQSGIGRELADALSLRSAL